MMIKSITKFSVSALIDSSPQIVYAIIADNHNDHPKILLEPPFVSLIVEQGGKGAGTIALVQMKVMGKLQSFRSVVTEPEPGRILVETNDTGYITTFTVEPRNEGKHSYVSFITEISEDAGFFKKLGFKLTKLLLNPVYRKELENLAELAKSKTG